MPKGAMDKTRFVKIQKKYFASFNLKYAYVKIYSMVFIHPHPNLFTGVLPNPQADQETR